MNRYNIYCTEEQSRKAFGLGAPVNKKVITYTVCTQPSSDYEEEFTEETDELILPTAEQIIGWLEEQGVFISIVPDTDKNTCANCVETKEYTLFNEVYNSRKEAILSAIDAALKYLTKNKK